MRTLIGHRHAIRALAYHPAGMPLLASAGDDRSIRLWDPGSGREQGMMESRHDGLLTLAFAPDGRTLASGGRAGSLIIWDVASRMRLPGTTYCLGPIVTVAFTADGRALLGALRSQRYGEESGRLICLNLHPAHPLQQLDWTGDLESAAVAPTRDLLAVAGTHRGVELWEVGKRQRDPDFWVPSRVRTLTFCPQGKQLAVATGRVLKIWDVEAQRWLVECQGHRAEVRSVAFSPDGRHLLSGGADRSVRLWETLTGRQLAAWDWQVGGVNAVTFSPDGMTGACGGDKPIVVIWDLDEG